MRYVLPLVVLLVARAAALAAQSSIHEYRPELIVTLPRVHGVGLQLMTEQHLAVKDLAPNERIQGVAIVSPIVDGVSATVELRQVLQNGLVEHRWIPTVNARLGLPAGFELLNRSRVEFRDIAGTWSRRYQDRVTIGHGVMLWGTRLFPYGSADASFDSRYSTVNRRETLAGMRVPLHVGGNTSIDAFVTRQVDDRRATRVLVASGAILRVAL